MIVPNNRLLFWAGFILIPFATLGLIIPSVLALSLIIAGSLLSVVLIDAILSHRRLYDLILEFPENIRVAKGHEGVIEIYVSNIKLKIKTLRMGLAFPDEISSEKEDMLIDLPAKDVNSHFKWTFKPQRRGRYFFDSCYLETSSYLGFWALRRTKPAVFEIRVYPDLSFERKNLAAIFLNRGNFGIHAQRHIGQGRDFEKLREYIHGDSYEHIHWKTTAKRGRPVTKVFQIERTQEVYVIVDASRLSGRILPATDQIMALRKNMPFQETFLEKYISAALVMGVAARRQGDLFGVLSFSNKIHNFIRAKTGREHYNACREALHDLQPAIVTPDFDELSSFIGLRLRRRALLIFLTNLDDPVISESFIKNIELLSRKHLILTAMIRPKGIKPVFLDPLAKTDEDVYKKLGGHILWHNLRELEKKLQRKGVQFSMLNNEMICSHLVSQYMAVKQRQLI